VKNTDSSAYSDVFFFSQEFHETLHSLLLWLAKAESQRYMVNIHDTNTDLNILEEHRDTLKVE